MSKIDWLTDKDGTPGKSWSPLAGCSPVSEGCANCWAARLLATRLKHNKDFGGLAEKRGDRLPGQRHEDAPWYRWTGTVRLLPHRLEEPLRWRKPRRIFVAPYSDLFHEDVPFEYIAAVYGVMAAAASVRTFIVPTKRAQRMVEWYRWVDTVPGRAALARGLAGYEHRMHIDHETLKPWPLPNVHVGVTVENQPRADERLEQLKQIPAALHWASYEPALGPVDFSRWLSWLRWIVPGCESGPRARPMDIEWAQYVTEQCAAAGVPCFVKQLPGYPPTKSGAGGRGLLKSEDCKRLGWPVELPEVTP